MHVRPKIPLAAFSIFADRRTMNFVTLIVLFINEVGSLIVKVGDKGGATEVDGR